MLCLLLSLGSLFEFLLEKQGVASLREAALKQKTLTAEEHKESQNSLQHSHRAGMSSLEPPWVRHHMWGSIGTVRVDNRPLSPLQEIWMQDASGLRNGFRATENRQRNEHAGRCDCALDLLGRSLISVTEINARRQSRRNCCARLFGRWFGLLL